MRARSKVTILKWSLSIVPAVFLEGLRVAAGVPFSWGSLLIHWAFVIGLLLAARWARISSAGEAVYVWPWWVIAFVGAGGLAGLIYVLNGTTIAAWIMLGVLYAILLVLDKVLVSGQGILQSWVIHGLLALAGGTMSVALAQIESQFAEEEFFAALQALALTAFLLLLMIVWQLLWPREPVQVRRGLQFNRRWLAMLLIFTVSAGLGVTVRAYQHSFYPSQAPAYDDISASMPFVCGEVPADSQTFDGGQVFHRLLARLEANPRKGAPEYGMLALGGGEHSWAQAFRESLLNEASQGLFTGPANSVKSAQYEATLRAYYYSRVRTVFPDLFTADEEQKLHQWFVSINRRALTVEWVDWMYALAFAKWPEGPYENQENGAGLLAMLESTGLADSALSPINRGYLERNQRGWVTGFRNTDDALLYQPMWLNNALFQSQYTGKAPEPNRSLSFAWLLLQALPDCAPLRYNKPESGSLAEISYLGAYLLDDARYVWLAGKALMDLESRGGYLVAQPGVEQPVDLEGRSPTQGSCLLYGNSGLPNQAGPLAPDKIVFRDGWSDDSAYLLLNLRFTGWHRYKATNTLSLLYQNGYLAAEELGGKSFTWLPVGRSLFRDKRIPRENLNGLLVEGTGMSAVLYEITGIGSPWAQDPPYYAKVERFETGPPLDISSIVLEGWRGWQHKRTVYFYHKGPIAIVDDAQGPIGHRAALIWHVVGDGQVQGQRIRLRYGNNPAEMLLLPLSPGKVQVEKKPIQGDNPNLQVLYDAPANGRLSMVTLFLIGEWVGAEAEITQEAEGLVVQIIQGEKRITLSL